MNNEVPHTTKKSLNGWIAGLILIGGLAAIGGIYWNNHVTVSSVSFEGDYFTTQKELRSIVVIPDSTKPDSLDFDKIRNRVQALDYVKKATIQVEPGGDIIVVISEREPIALLADMSPKKYVDSEGVLLPVIDGKTKDVPLLYGFGHQSPDTLKGEPFNQINRFLTSAKKMPLCWITISEVAFSNEMGVVALSQENGVKLIFGKDEFSKKLANWESFYTKVIRYKGIDRVNEVDLRFNNQIVTKET